jgi:hypothetical protein
MYIYLTGWKGINSEYSNYDIWVNIISENLKKERKKEKKQDLPSESANLQ